MRTRDYYLAESSKSEGISFSKEVRASFVADNRDGIQLIKIKRAV